MPHYNLAFLGFGNVGQALARLLLNKEEELRARYGLSFTVTGIATGSHGAVINRNGIDIDDALSWIGAGKAEDRPVSLHAFSGSEPAPVDSLDFIRRCGADVLFENTPVNYHTGQPAVDHLREALEHGMHAITANKGPVVHAYSELIALAEEKGLSFFFESAVMDGAPVFSMFRDALPAANLTSFRGVLNSTTNLILTRMEAGESFDRAVAYAQSIGIPETDPSGDIDGWDAAVKVAALVTVLMGFPLKPDQVDRQGIRGITLEDIAEARAQGARWKLVCSANRLVDGISARVAPEMIPASSALYQVSGTTSIVEFRTDVLGQLSLIEEDPGPSTTAYGLLADFINAVKI
jgi:homoserine dehydrogenase